MRRWYQIVPSDKYVFGTENEIAKISTALNSNNEGKTYEIIPVAHPKGILASDLLKAIDAERFLDSLIDEPDFRPSELLEAIGEELQFDPLTDAVEEGSWYQILPTDEYVFGTEAEIAKISFAFNSNYHDQTYELRPVAHEVETGFRASDLLRAIDEVLLLDSLKTDFASRN